MFLNVAKGLGDMKCFRYKFRNSNLIENISFLDKYSNKSACTKYEKSVKKILDFYNAYISKVCLHPCYHVNGTVHMQVDEELKGEIHVEMMNLF